jgi:Lon-like protease
MTSRTAAILTGGLLLLMLIVAAVRLPVPFVSLEPGLTLDVLERQGEKSMVRVQGSKTYPTSGALRLVTVSETTPEHRVGLVEALDAWVRPGTALYPRDVAFPEQTTNDDLRAASAAQMVSSQDTAVAAALRELGYELERFPVVAGVTPGGPSVGRLKVRDEIVSIAGTLTPDVRSVFDAVAEVEPGSEVEVEVVRRGTERRVEVTMGSDPDDEDRALLGVYPGSGFRFPFDVSVGIGDRIGGPSAGLVFALAIYDTLTPGALTGGRSVAATGSIDARGRVGEIGGVQQKVVGAWRDGSTLFLLPPGNCDSALAAPVDDDEIALVPVAGLDDAIRVVKTHADDPDAELPRCTDES